MKKLITFLPTLIIMMASTPMLAYPLAIKHLLMSW